MLQTMKKGRSATALPDMIDPRAMFEMAISRPISHDISGNDLEVFHEQYSNSKASSCISGNPNQIQQGECHYFTPTASNSVIREFHLAAQGDWVHFITMAHITLDIARYFIYQLPHP
jgi:hypothetical protein